MSKVQRTRMLTYGGQKGRGDSIRDGYLSTGIDRRKEHKAERGREGQTKDTRKTEAVMVQGLE